MFNTVFYTMFNTVFYAMFNTVFQTCFMLRFNAVLNAMFNALVNAMLNATTNATFNAMLNAISISSRFDLFSIASIMCFTRVRPSTPGTIYLAHEGKDSFERLVTPAAVAEFLNRHTRTHARTHALTHALQGVWGCSAVAGWNRRGGRAVPCQPRAPQLYRPQLYRP